MDDGKDEAAVWDAFHVVLIDSSSKWPSTSPASASREQGICLGKLIWKGLCIFLLCCRFHLSEAPISMDDDSDNDDYQQEQGSHLY